MIKALVIAVALLGATGPAIAQQTSALTLRGGTPVPLVTVRELSTRTHRQGDRVTLAVASDVIADGRVAIPKGAPAVGEVAQHAARAYFGQSGRLEVRLLYAKVGERIVRLEGAAQAGGDDNVGADAVASAVVSSLIGTFIAGKNGVIPAGTAVTGYVHRDIIFP